MPSQNLQPTSENNAFRRKAENESGQYSTTCLINYNQISYGTIQTDSFLGGQAREEFLEELEGEEGRDKEG